MKPLFPLRVTSFAFALALAAGPAAAADLGGHWYIESTLNAPASPFFEWTQVGDTFSVPCEVFSSPSSDTCDGTISGDQLATSTGILLDATIFAGDTIIDGGLTTPPSPVPARARFLAHRCECFDGDEDDGDGCDSECRIEPCYSCTGEPSVCTPLGDGAACNDRLDCTSGETCTSGACGGGSAVPGCIDLTGRWQVFTTSQDALTQLTHDLRDIEQRDGVLRMTRPVAFAMTHTLESPTSVPAEIGTIDSSTGAIDLIDGTAQGSPYWNLKPDSLNASVPSCGPVSISGTAAANGQTFSGSGSKTVENSFTVGTSGYFRGTCTEERGFEWSATKCGAGECDVLADECPPCTRADGEGSCEIGPREGCLTSPEPRRSSLLMAQSAKLNGDKLRWKWKNGMSFDSALLGEPRTFTGMQVCVFDESGPAPQLVFSTYWNPHNPYPEDNASWESDADDLRFQRDGYAGKETVSWVPSTEERSSLMLSGRGGEPPVADYLAGLADGFNFDDTWFLESSFYEPFALPAAPLNLPVRIQARMDHGGACFESLFGTEGVRKNADGKFSAKATE